MEVNKEKIRYILQFSFDKGENASQAAKIGNDVYGVDTKTAITCNFGFVDSVKTFLMLKFKKEAQCLGATLIKPKHMIDRISICEALVKRNEIDPFLKRMVNGNEKWVTYDKIVGKNDRGQSAVKQLKRWTNQTNG
ncbi:histone-lysine N-methyltransferase SETMAR [Trichonephila clavipes]|nr:histone-lysine N-methyltransferase SETMAR [Trichonephila clavipes]